jgi:hypothetical protein
MCDGKNAVCSHLNYIQWFILTDMQFLGIFRDFTCMGSVLAAIDAKMVKPAADRPYEGMISIHSEISPMASSEYEQGRCVRPRHQVWLGLV